MLLHEINATAFDRTCRRRFQRTCRTGTAPCSYGGEDLSKFLIRAEEHALRVLEQLVAGRGIRALHALAGVMVAMVLSWHGKYLPKDSRGGIVCIGSGCYDWYAYGIDASADKYHGNVAKLTENAIDYLTGK